MFGEKRENPRDRIGKFIDEIIKHEGGWRKFQPHLHGQTLTLGYDFLDVFSGRASGDIANIIADKFQESMDLPGGFRETWGLQEKEKSQARRKGLEQVFKTLTAGASGDESNARIAILCCVFEGFHQEICPDKNDEEVFSGCEKFSKKMRIKEAEKMVIIAKENGLQTLIYKELRRFTNKTLSEKGGKENGLCGSKTEDGEIKPGGSGRG